MEGAAVATAMERSSGEGGGGVRRFGDHGAVRMTPREKIYNDREILCKGTSQRSHFVPSACSLHELPLPSNSCLVP